MSCHAPVTDHIGEETDIGTIISGYRMLNPENDIFIVKLKDGRNKKIMRWQLFPAI